MNWLRLFRFMFGCRLCVCVCCFFRAVNFIKSVAVGSPPAKNSDRMASVQINMSVKAFVSLKMCHTYATQKMTSV